MTENCLETLKTISKTLQTEFPKCILFFLSFTRWSPFTNGVWTTLCKFLKRDYETQLLERKIDIKT